MSQSNHPIQKIQTKGLNEFFREKIHAAKLKQEIEINDEIEYYLVNLLSECARTDFLYPEKSNYEDTLTCRLMRALEEPQCSKRIPILKNLGDFSLYMTGFHAESLHRKAVDVNYYIQMGESAYLNLSGLLNQDKNFSTLYETLSRNFCHYVDLIAEVSDHTDRKTALDILHLYETWLRTGSPRAYRMLKEAGLLQQESSLKIQ